MTSPLLPHGGGEKAQQSAREKGNQWKEGTKKSKSAHLKRSQESLQIALQIRQKKAKKRNAAEVRLSCLSP